MYSFVSCRLIGEIFFLNSEWGYPRAQTSAGGGGGASPTPIVTPLGMGSTRRMWFAMDKADHVTEGYPNWFSNTVSGTTVYPDMVLIATFCYSRQYINPDYLNSSPVNVTYSNSQQTEI